MPYFILHSSEDGTSIKEVSETELLKSITPDKDGYTDYGSKLEFLDKIPKSDKGYWLNVSENAILIIKGDIIIPKKVQVVTKFEL